MFRRTAIPVLAGCLLSLLLAWPPAAALAQNWPVAGGCQVVMTGTHPAVSMFLVPNGSGTPLVNCYGFGGAPASVTLAVSLFDAAGMPVPAYPANQIQIEPFGTSLAWCSASWYPPPPHAPNCADLPTNAAGTTTFTRSYHGGGVTAGPTRVWVVEANGAWMPIPTPVAVRWNSADLNGDLIVNLVDVGLFSSDFFGGLNPYRSDFNWDGVINLTDVGLMAGALNLTCP